MRKIFANNQGLTLLELIVVMFILSILITAILITGNFTTSLKKGRDSRRLQDLKNIQNALEAYRSLEGSYPGTAFGCSVQLTGGTPSQPLLKFPCDPLDPVAGTYPCTPSGSDCNADSYKYCANTELIPTPCVTNLQ